MIEEHFFEKIRDKIEELKKKQDELKNGVDSFEKKIIKEQIDELLKIIKLPTFTEILKRISDIEKEVDDNELSKWLSSIDYRVDDMRKICNLLYDYNKYCSMQYSESCIAKMSDFPYALSHSISDLLSNGTHSLKDKSSCLLGYLMESQSLLRYSSNDDNNVSVHGVFQGKKDDNTDDIQLLVNNAKLEEFMDSIDKYDKRFRLISSYFNNFFVNQKDRIITLLFNEQIPVAKSDIDLLLKYNYKFDVDLSSYYKVFENLYNLIRKRDSLLENKKNSILFKGEIRDLNAEIKIELQKAYYYMALAYSCYLGIPRDKISFNDQDSAKETIEIAIDSIRMFTDRISKMRIEINKKIETNLDFEKLKIRCSNGYTGFIPHMNGLSKFDIYDSVADSISNLEILKIVKPLLYQLSEPLDLKGTSKVI